MLFLPFYFYRVGLHAVTRRGKRSAHHGGSILEAEDVSETLQTTTPDKASTIFLGIAVEPVVGIVLEEEREILVGRIVQTVFQADIIEERAIALLQLGTRRHHATYGDLQPVVEEALGKLERIVGMGLTRTIERLIDTEGEVEGAQGIARDAADQPDTYP